MFIVWTVWTLVDLKMTGDAINHHCPAPPEGHQDAPGNLRIPFPSL